MASLKWVLMIGSFLAATSAFAEDPPIVGIDGHTVTFRATEWTMPGVDSATAWFTANGKTFPLFSADVGADGEVGGLCGGYRDECREADKLARTEGDAGAGFGHEAVLSFMGVDHLRLRPAISKKMASMTA